MQARSKPGLAQLAAIFRVTPVELLLAVTGVGVWRGQECSPALGPPGSPSPWVAGSVTVTDSAGTSTTATIHVNALFDDPIDLCHIKPWMC